MLARFAVIASVNLDNQSLGQAYKVCYIIADGVLSAESELWYIIAQCIPQSTLGISHVFSVLFGKVFENTVPVRVCCF